MSIWSDVAIILVSQNVSIYISFNLPSIFGASSALCFPQGGYANTLTASEGDAVVQRAVTVT